MAEERHRLAVFHRQIEQQAEAAPFPHLRDQRTHRFAARQHLAAELLTRTIQQFFQGIPEGTTGKKIKRYCKQKCSCYTSFQTKSTTMRVAHTYLDAELFLCPVSLLIA